MANMEINSYMQKYFKKQDNQQENKDNTNLVYNIIDTDYIKQKYKRNNIFIDETTSDNDEKHYETRKNKEINQIKQNKKQKLLFNDIEQYRNYGFKQCCNKNCLNKYNSNYLFKNRKTIDSFDNNEKKVFIDQHTIIVNTKYGSKKSFMLMEIKYVKKHSWNYME